jgi:hypothetical protein
LAIWQYLCKVNKLFKNKEMNVTAMVMEAYEAPQVEVIEVEVEKGFAASQTETFFKDDESEW